MANKHWCIVANLSDEQREMLLRSFPPRFKDVYCRQLMWWYDPPRDTPFPHEVELWIDARHTADAHEALTGWVEFGAEHNVRTRPDGVPVHITLSCAPGVAPVNAGVITIDRLSYVLPETRLKLRFERRHPSRILPEARWELV